MALPSIMRKLFRNDGYGPLLKDEIIDRHISIQDWSSTYDYPVNTLVRGSDGLPYWSVAQSGPNTGGAKDPTTDDGSYWMYMVTEQWVRDNIAPNTLYLDAANGSDSNSGLTESDPLQTFGAAQLKLTGLKNYANLSSYVKLVLLPGSYGDIVYEGNQLPPLWFDFRSGASVACIRVTGATQVKISGVATFDSSGSDNQIFCGSNTYILISAGTTVYFRGSTGSCLAAARNSVLYVSSGATLNFYVTVIDAVARTHDLGLIHCLSKYVTIQGSATGRRYYASNMSEICTYGGANFFPGTSAGSASASSLYV